MKKSEPKWQCLRANCKNPWNSGVISITPLATGQMLSSSKQHTDLSCSEHIDSGSSPLLRGPKFDSRSSLSEQSLLVLVEVLNIKHDEKAKEENTQSSPSVLQAKKS
jgi:hypothetical protein